MDQSYRFANKFNSDQDLRLRLWKEGFHSELKHLPGLLDQEEESLKVYLKILYLLYFKAKEGKFSQLESAGSDVFELSAQVMNKYVLKNKELVSINASKQT